MCPSTRSATSSSGTRHGARNARRRSSRCAIVLPFRSRRGCGRTFKAMHPSPGSAAPVPGARAPRESWSRSVGRDGDMRILAFLTDPPVVQGILLHLDLPHRPPPVAPARGRLKVTSSWIRLSSSAATRLHPLRCFQAWQRPVFASPLVALPRSSTHRSRRTVRTAHPAPAPPPLHPPERPSYLAFPFEMAFGFLSFVTFEFDAAGGEATAVRIRGRRQRLRRGGTDGRLSRDDFLAPPTGLRLYLFLCVRTSCRAGGTW